MSDVSRSERLRAVLLGLCCHGTFLYAVWTMFWAIESGMRDGHGALRGISAIAANMLLVAQFPLVHSFLLDSQGRKILAKIGGRRGGDLSTTTFAFISSLQLLAVFKLWSPSGINLFELPHPLLGIMESLYCLSWLLLARAMLDAGFQVQSGALGWWSVARGKKPTYPGMPERGTFRVVRQPIYLAFALILWTSPAGTFDRLMLASFWTHYLFFGPRRKELRFEQFFGDAFRAYRARTPYFFPSIRFRRSA